MAERNQIKSLTALYEAYSGPVFNYLLRLSGDRPLAEDLTSETFFRAVLAIDSFRGDANVKTWLIRIARNLYLRRAAREQRSISLEAMQAGGFQVPAPQASPEKSLLDQERGEAIQAALLALSESDRTLLLLVSQEDLPQRDIAEVLDISVSAVKVRLHRARGRFAKALAQVQKTGVKNGEL
jgi:RNA polymerase sigma-70 factor (ECF subfamily)